MGNIFHAHQYLLFNIFALFLPSSFFLVLEAINGPTKVAGAPQLCHHVFKVLSGKLWRREGQYNQRKKKQLKEQFASLAMALNSTVKHQRK